MIRMMDCVGTIHQFILLFFVSAQVIEFHKAVMLLWAVESGLIAPFQMRLQGEIFQLGVAEVVYRAQAADIAYGMDFIIFIAIIHQSVFVQKPCRVIIFDYCLDKRTMAGNCIMHGHVLLAQILLCIYFPDFYGSFQIPAVVSERNKDP